MIAERPNSAANVSNRQRQLLPISRAFFTVALPLLFLSSFVSIVSAKGMGAEAPVCNRISNNNSRRACEKTEKQKECALWLAPAMQQQDEDEAVNWALYAGTNFWANQTILADIPDLLVHMTDAKKNEFSPWWDYSWLSSAIQPSLIHENRYHNEVLFAGLGSLAGCGGSAYDGHMAASYNIRRVARQDKISSEDPMSSNAGSSSIYSHYYYEAARHISSGEELLQSCELANTTNASDEEQVKKIRMKRSNAWLKENGICLWHTKSSLSVKDSPIQGKGLFVQKAVTAGETILTTPVIPVDRSQMDIVQQELKEEHIIPAMRDHGIEYKASTVLGQQVLLNYCFGNVDSDVLLWPLAPAVSFLNHNHKKHNAELRWSAQMSEQGKELLDGSVTTLHELVSNSASTGALLLDVVAIRDIEDKEEIVLDYGAEWQGAWEQHVQSWKTRSNYVSPSQFASEHNDDGKRIRTVLEQLVQPYPDNLHTVCRWSSPLETQEEMEQLTNAMAVNEQVNGNHPIMLEFDFAVSSDVHREFCPRPCHVQERMTDPITGAVYYTVIAWPVDSYQQPPSCGFVPVETGLTVSWVPASAIDVVEKPYSSPQHWWDLNFRHEIRVPKSFQWPKHWMRRDLNPTGDFKDVPLQPGQLAPIRWKDNGQIVTDLAYTLGLHDNIREVLLEYCRKMGITDIMRHVTVDDNSLEPGTDTYVQIQGQKWFLQRPEQQWRSNLHWLSPADFGSHENYLQALGQAGFDDMLSAVGEYLNLDGLVAFHVTFIAVSRSERGHMHYDHTKTGSKVYNIIVPLVLANETGPELDIAESYRQNMVGRYKYEYGTASVLGDDVYHATSACDYRHSKEMRLAATVYVADVSMANVGSVMQGYTQVFPPPNNRNLILSWAGRHWKKDDPTRRLPLPDKNHVLVTGSPAATSKY